MAAKKPKRAFARPRPTRKASAKTPVAEKPGGKKPAAKKAVKRPTGKRPAAKKRAAKKRAAKKRVTKKPAAKKRAATAGLEPTASTRAPDRRGGDAAVMDTDGFWAVVAASRAGFDPNLRDGNMDRQEQRLAELLAARTPDEIIAFDERFDERRNEAYRWDLWGAAYVIEGGCSDDGFMDFRSWLISMGREVYEAALRDPESLVDVADAPGVEVTSFEGFAYIARRVYEEKAGEEMPDRPSSHPPEPKGERWSEEGDALARLLPRLWAKYGESSSPG